MGNLKNLFLVGIASSAGGLQPMMELIEEAICHKTMAYIVVPHLSPDFESTLPQILKRISNLTIEKITDGLDIKPCHLYVLPPGKYARVEENKFVLEPRPRKSINHAADILFKSLAEHYSQNAIGVVLSGAAVGADGSEGVCAIKSRGGYTFAQDPSSAQYSDMPSLAIKTGCVDVILPPKEIGNRLSKVVWA